MPHLSDPPPPPLAPPGSSRTPRSPVPRTPPRAPRAKHGFTLIEILIAVAIVGILLSVGFTSLPRERFAARETARIVAADLTRGRSEAIRLNTRVAVSFAPGQACGRWCVFTDYDRTGLPDGSLYGGTENDPNYIAAADFSGAEIAHPLLQSRTVESSPAVAIAGADFGGGTTVWFNVRGLPTTAAGGLLPGTGTVTISASGAPLFDVHVDPSGRVRVVGR